MKSPLPFLPSFHTATSNAQHASPFNQLGSYFFQQTHCIIHFPYCYRQTPGKVYFGSQFEWIQGIISRKGWPWEGLMVLPMNVGSGWIHGLCSQKEIKLSLRPGHNLQWHPLRDPPTPVGLYLLKVWWSPQNQSSNWGPSVHTLHTQQTSS